VVGAELAAGKYFPLSVTDVDTEAGTAQGVRMVSTTHVTVELTEDQVEAVGLPRAHASPSAKTSNCLPPGDDGTGCGQSGTRGGR
jgi:hypothetical protein